MTTDKTAEHLQIVRECIEFYADIENWKWRAKPTDSLWILDCGSEVQRDFSKKAKQALPSLDALEAYFNNQPKGN